MGMGEPFDNWEEVHEALRGLTHQCLFGLKAKHVTVSTVGAAPSKIRAMADVAPQISLALSLHSAVQKSREKLIPSATANHLEKLGEALDYHSQKSGRGAMLEYLLIDNVNDSDEEVDALAKFCIDRESHGVGKVFVNLIPYNPTLAGENFGYQTPQDDRIFAFHNKLRDLGVKSLIRWSSTNGRDTNGACGQLVLSTGVP
jgi:adenine C2-methylase RlmN of 23S rRNA A2503 and tRNA A37